MGSDKRPGKKKLCARFLVVKEPCARNSPFGSWLQFWPKCPAPLVEKVEKWLFSQIEARDVLIGGPLSKWMDFQLGFFARKLPLGITQHLSALGVLGLAGKLVISNYTFVALAPQISIRFRKFTSLSDGNKSSHHCQIKKGSHWFVETDSHLSRKHENYCNPWNSKRDIVSKSRNILNTPQPKSHNERSVLIAHIPY